MDCSCLSPFGRIRSAWRYEGNQIRYRIELPCSASARVCLPGREPVTLEAGEYTFEERL